MSGVARMPSAVSPAPVAAASPGTLGNLRRSLGFKTGASGAHSARTMMLADLTALLRAAPALANRDEFNRLIVEENLLGKRTTSNRWLTARHLADLYALDLAVPVFRLLRQFWETDGTGRPLLALLCAHARDPLLRVSSELVLDTRPGRVVTSAYFVERYQQALPGRFSDAMCLSLAQNVASSWAQAGFFAGKVRKVRTRPAVTPATAAYGLALGYLSGLRGQVLLESGWVRLLDVGRPQVLALAQEASRRNWVDIKTAGNVIEIAFPELLNPGEIQASHGTD